MEFLRQTSPVIHQIKKSKLLFIFWHLGLVVPSANCGQIKTSVSGMYACITSLIPKFAEGQATNCKQACIGLSLFCKYHIAFAPKFRRKQGPDVVKWKFTFILQLMPAVCCSKAEEWGECLSMSRSYSYISGKQGLGDWSLLQITSKIQSLNDRP